MLLLEFSGLPVDDVWDWSDVIVYPALNKSRAPVLWERSRIAALMILNGKQDTARFKKI